MKLVSKLSIVAVAMLITACALRDTTHYYSIQDALNSSEAKEIIDPSVKSFILVNPHQVKWLKSRFGK